MKNVRDTILKKCIFLTTDEFESIIKSLFGFADITYEMDGMTIYGHDDVINTDLLHDRLAKYFDVEKITSIHIDDCDEIGVWIVYKGDSYPTPDPILNTETLPEFKGQVIDILEDYFEEHHVNIPCTDKDDAIKDGEDPSGLAIIYGEDYDKLGDEIEYYINLKKSDDKPVKFEPSEMRAISGKLVDIAAGLLEKITDNAVRTASISNMNKDKKELRHKIADTFAEWRLYGQTYYVSHRVDGRYHTEVIACSIEDAIKKSDYNFQEADFGELECIDSYANAVEDETGNVVWDRA